MSRLRRFDWDEARRRHANGESLTSLAAEYGVTATAVWRVMDSERLARGYARNAAWIRAGQCPDCGGPATRHRKDAVCRCRACAIKAAATSARDGELQCVTCRRWKPDSSFPHHRGQPGRRYRHSCCRACLTEQRRAYREARKVPCSHGCGTLVLHENGGKPPECHPCAVRRIKAGRHLIGKDTR